MRALFIPNRVPDPGRSCPTSPPRLRGVAGVVSALGLLLALASPAAAQPQCLPPDNVTCTLDATGSIVLTWTNPQAYDQIQIVCDGIAIAFLPGTATTHTFATNPPQPQVCCQVVGVLILPGAPPTYCPSADCCTGCLPPFDVSCVFDPATGAVTLSWTNGQPYDAIDIECGGVVVATLPGTATSYVHFSPPPVSQSCCRVIGLIQIAGTPPQRCISDECCTDCLPPSNLSCAFDPLVGGLVLSWFNPQVYSAIEIECDGVVVASLLGTDTSYVAPIMPGQQTCCRVIGLVIASDGTLERCPSELCCSGCLPPDGLQCSEVQPGAIQLTWNNPQAYFSINVYCNGNLVASLPGNATSHLLTGFPPNTQICCQVAGVIVDATGLTVECFSQECCFGCAAPFGLQCSLGPVAGTVILNWTNGQPYSQINILCNFTVVATLSGTATSYVHTGVPAGTYVCYQIIGVVFTNPATPPTECLSQECCVTTEIEFPCPPRDLVRIINTGFDQNAGVIGPNNPDDEWMVTRDSDLAGNGAVAPFVSTPEPIAAEVRAPHPAWGGPLVGPGATGSAWVYHSINSANGIFEYQYCFCLQEGFSNAQLSMDLLADDVAQVYLNGNLILSTVNGFAFLIQNLASVTVTNQALFNAGENCIKVRVRNTAGVVTGFNAVGLVTATNGECCCVSPPFDMVGWWPLDQDSSPSTAEDIARGNDGSVQPAVYQTGLVAESLSFNGSTLVNVPDDPALDFGAPTGLTVGDFSIDAWIRLTGTAPNEYPIVSKLGAGGAGAGYALYVDNSGFLSFLVQDSSLGNIYTPTNLAANVQDGSWHHVAVTYDRDRAPNGIKMYVDGNRVDPNTFAGTAFGSLSNAAPFWIGGGTFPVQSFFEGNIDEVEVFDRVLLAGEVRELYEAGAYGKCKEYCHVPWDRPVVSNGTITVVATVCNDGLLPQTYNISSLPLSPGPGCSLGGPVSIVHAPTVTVPAGGCVNVPVTFTAPTGPGISCYTLCFQNPTTGYKFCCRGSLQVGQPIIIVLPNDPILVEVASPLPIAVGITNTLPAPVSVAYRVFPTAMNCNFRTIRLDGLPPGEPLMGTLTVAAGATENFDLIVEYVDLDPFRMQDIVIEADIDGDGLPDAASSVAIASTLEPVVAGPTLRRADCNVDGSLNIADAIFLLGYLFSGGASPSCEDSCDANDDGQLNIADGIYVLTHLFANGAEPPAPFP
ncbi:MAG: LamG-like jellyroll fold domain-containing protein, partial [Planctomycetota bacterium]